MSFLLLLLSLLLWFVRSFLRNVVFLTQIHCQQSVDRPTISITPPKKNKKKTNRSDGLRSPRHPSRTTAQRPRHSGSSPGQSFGTTTIPQSPHNPVSPQTRFLSTSSNSRYRTRPGLGHRRQTSPVLISDLVYLFNRHLKQPVPVTPRGLFTQPRIMHANAP